EASPWSTGTNPLSLFQLPSSQTQQGYYPSSGVGVGSSGAPVIHDIPLPASLSAPGVAFGSKINRYSAPTDFPILSMHRNSPVAIIGGIRSGKTNQMAYIYQVMGYKRLAAFLGGSDAAFWRNYIPDENIHEFSQREWDPTILERILNHQENI